MFLLSSVLLVLIFCLIIRCPLVACFEYITCFKDELSMVHCVDMVSALRLMLLDLCHWASSQEMGALPFWLLPIGRSILAVSACQFCCVCPVYDSLCLLIDS